MISIPLIICLQNLKNFYLHTLFTSHSYLNISSDSPFRSAPFRDAPYDGAHDASPRASTVDDASPFRRTQHAHYSCTDRTVPVLHSHAAQDSPVSRSTPILPPFPHHVSSNRGSAREYFLR